MLCHHWKEQIQKGLSKHGVVKPVTMDRDLCGTMSVWVALAL